MSSEIFKLLYIDTDAGTNDVRASEAAQGIGHAEGGTYAGLVSFKTSPLEVRTDRATREKTRIKRMQRAVWSSGHLQSIADHGHRPPVAHFVTLTYVGVHDWRADHISDATEQYRRHCARLGVPCRYLWVAELQMRGAVHYHLVAWLPLGVRMPHWDRTRTHKGREIKPFWSHGMTNTQVAKNAIGYLMKYLSKVGSKTRFPPNLRLYGCGGLDAQARRVRSWYNLPQWAKNEYGVGDLKRSGSKLVHVASGDQLPPMYQRYFVPGAVLLIPLRETSPKLHDGAYSTWPRCWQPDSV